MRLFKISNLKNIMEVTIVITEIALNPLPMLLFSTVR